MEEKSESATTTLPAQSPGCRFCLRLLGAALLVAGVARLAVHFLPDLSPLAESYEKVEAAAAVAGITFFASLATAIASGIGWLACNPNFSARVESFRFGLRDALWAMAVLGLLLA